MPHIPHSVARIMRSFSNAQFCVAKVFTSGI